MRGIPFRLACTPLLVVLSGCGRARPACYWAIDRGAGELVALDGELLCVERIAFPAPDLLAVSGEGVPWVAGPRPGDGPGLGRLERVLSRDAGRFRQPSGGVFGEILELVGTRGDGVLLLERGERRVFLWHLDATRGRGLLGAFPRARCVAAQAGELVVGGADGLLVCLDASGAVLAWAHGAAPIRGLAPGPRPGLWWGLRGGRETRIELLDRTLAPLWSARASMSAGSLAAVAGEERVWIAGGDRVARHGPGGLLELELEQSGGPWRVAGASAAGVLLWSVGAILQVDVLGRGPRVARSQGGFRELSGLVPAGPVSVRARAAPPPGASSRPERPPARAPG